MKLTSREQSIRDYYRVLSTACGPQHWWPARTRFEVIVGAYLTQNTSWKNVEIALRRLRQSGLLSLKGIREVRLARFEGIIRPAGYFRQKAVRLKTFVTFVDEQYRGSLNSMFAQPTSKLREQLLALNGIGPETADSILLYAGQHPVFVVDAYARRILERHGIVSAHASYEEIRDLFERALATAVSPRTPKTAKWKLRTDVPDSPHKPSLMSLAKRSPLSQIFNDMHGLIVGVGKHYCFKSNPDCDKCPLRGFLPQP